MHGTKSPRFANTAAAVALLLCRAAVAQDPPTPVDFDIEAQPMSEALTKLGEQSGLTIIVETRVSQGIRAAALAGRLSPDEALKKLLEPAGLKAEYLDSKTVTVRPASDEKSHETDTTGAVYAEPVLRLAQSTSIREAERNDSAGETSAASTTVDKTSIDEVIVTGTSLRGIAPDSSPVLVYTRKDIDASGYTTVEQFMRAVPQNFGGGIGQESFQVFGASNNTNTQGAGINLRGLGQRATLVLLNGRRMAPTGDVGDYIDVSVIPLSAIERIEILTNGASAIYGSDAVGGVVNYILRKDFDGQETALTLGSATTGDGDQVEVAHTMGTVWSSGQGLLSYEYRSQDRVLAGDRPFLTGVAPEAIFLPEEVRNSVFGTLRQNLTSRLSADLSASYLERDTQRDYVVLGLFTKAEARNRVHNIGGELTFDIDSNWVWQIGASYSSSDGASSYDIPVTPPAWGRSKEKNELVELGTKISGDLFQLGGGAVKVAAGLQRIEEQRDVFYSFLASNLPASPPTTAVADRASDAVFAEVLVPVVSASNRRGGIERLEVSLAARYQDYGSIGDTLDPKIGVMWAPTRGLMLRATYDTSFRAPLLHESEGIYSAIYYPAAAAFADPTQASGFPLVLLGNQRDVKPEVSKTWTAGLEFSPTDDLRLTLGYYSTEYSDRIVVPFSGSVNIIGDPDYAAIVDFSPPPERVLDLLGGASVVTDLTGPGFTSGGRVPEDVTVIVDARTGNSARTRTDGVDMGLTYGFSVGASRMTAMTNATYITRFDTQLSSSSPVIETLNTPFNPVDLRARLGLAWEYGGWNGNVSWNHVPGYSDNRFAPTVGVDDFNTVDLTFGYTFASRSPLLRGLRISVNALNVFDAEPPLLRKVPGFAELGIYEPGYDPANASGRGRLLAIQAKKLW